MSCCPRRNRQADGRAPAESMIKLFGFAAFAIASAIGCQALLPSKLTTFGEDRRILKEAEHDPFPSPSDVGIEPLKDKK